MSRDKGNNKYIPSEYVDLWSEKPDEDEGFYNCEGYLAVTVQKLFPSVHPGDCIEVAGTGKGVVNYG